jgi:hypothetical protein
VDQRTYNAVTGALFLIVALLHLLRIVFGWGAEIGGLGIPIWASWLGLLVAGAFAYFGLRQNLRT